MCKEICGRRFQATEGSYKSKNKIQDVQTNIHGTQKIKLEILSRVHEIYHCFGCLCGFFSERFPLPLGSWDGLRYFIVALPEPSI